MSSGSEVESAAGTSSVTPLPQSTESSAPASDDDLSSSRESAPHPHLPASSFGTRPPAAAALRGALPIGLFFFFFPFSPCLHRVLCFPLPGLSSSEKTVMPPLQRPRPASPPMAGPPSRPFTPDPTKKPGVDPLMHFACFFGLAILALCYLTMSFGSLPPQIFTHQQDESTSLQGTDLIGPVLFGIPVEVPFAVSFLSLSKFHQAHLFHLQPLFTLFFATEVFLLMLLNKWVFRFPANTVCFPSLLPTSPLSPLTPNHSFFLN